MRSAIFVIYSMNVGGVEKALLGVINKFLAEKWDVHIGMLYETGGFLPFIPKSVTIHKINGFNEIKEVIHTPQRDIIFHALKSGKLIKALRHLWFYLNIKFSNSAIRLYRYAFKSVPPISTQVFDLAIAFAGPDAFLDFYVANKIHAIEKWGWIHFDISKFGNDRGIIRKAYKDYSKINIVSIEAKRIFDEAFPQFRAKTVHTPNIIDKELIKKLAQEKIPLPKTNRQTVILTVGRVSREKGQYTALMALKSLIESGFNNVCWWFVGDGTDMDRCKEYVRENNLSPYVCFWGSQTNPYSYMANCNLYIQPSEHEGFCITLGEAKLFGMPIIATDFTGAHEQLKDYYNGIIVEHSAESIAAAIKKLIIDKENHANIKSKIITNPET